MNESLKKFVKENQKKIKDLKETIEAKLTDIAYQKSLIEDMHKEIEKLEQLEKDLTYGSENKNKVKIR